MRNSPFFAATTIAPIILVFGFMYLENCQSSFCMNTLRLISSWPVLVALLMLGVWALTYFCGKKRHAKRRK